jgi:hypothetical protein
MLNKEIINSSANSNFIKVAFDELMTYRTPKKIVDYIKVENTKFIIGNPPITFSSNKKQ